MPVDIQEFLEGIAVLADNQNMRVTMKESGKGGLICGVCCFIGGIIGGPVGLAVGGSVGGLAAYNMTGSKCSNYLPKFPLLSTNYYI